MAYQGITTSPVGSSDSLLQGGVKINSNFTEIYSAIGDGSTINLNQKVGYSTVVSVPSAGSVSPTASDNNTLYILEGVSSILNLTNVTTPPIGTRFGIISKNSLNRVARPIGFLIQGLDEDLVLDSDYSSLDLVYTGSAFGWAIK
jgi:hypothetical protein